MSEPVLTSASNVEEGNEVSIGGRWLVVEEVATAEVAGLVSIWVEEHEYTFNVGDQLAVVK